MGVLNTIQRWTLIIVIFLFPAFFLPTTQEFFITNKSYLVLFGSLLVLATIAIQTLVQRKIYLIKSPFTRILLAFLLIRGITVFFASPNRVQALYSLPTGLMVFFGLILMYFMVIYVAGTQRMKIPIQQAFNIGGLVAAFAIIVFFFKPLQGVNLPPHLTFLQGDLFSPVGNALDTLLLLGFIFVGLGTKVFTSLKTKATQGAAKLAIVAVIIAIAGGIIGTAVVRSNQSGQSLQFPPLSLSWFAAIETLKTPQTALIGTGVDNFDSIFTLVKPATYNTTDLWQVNFSLARSSILHIWVESGLLGLIALLLMFVYAIREVNGLLQGKDSDGTMYAVLGTYVGLALFLFPPSYIVLFMTFVYFAALSQKAMDHDHETVREIDLKSFAPVYIGVAIVLLGIIGGVGYYAGQAYAAQYYFKQSIDAIRTNDGQSVYSNLQRAVQIQPRNERLRAQFAQINLLLANNIARQEEVTDEDRQAIAQFIQQAISEAKALVALNPVRASNWNTLAVIYRNIINVAQGADAWTVASYQEAIRRDPQNPQLRLNLGGVYYAGQNYDAAIQNFEQAVVLKPDWANAHYNLAWALFQSGDAQSAVAVMQNVLQLVDESSDDYSTAQENLVLFNEGLETEATDSGSIEAPTNSGAPQQPLELPQEVEPLISPPIELPENSGPAEEIEAAPTPVVESSENNDQPAEIPPVEPTPST